MSTAWAEVTALLSEAAALLARQGDHDSVGWSARYARLMQAGPPRRPALIVGIDPGAVSGAWGVLTADGRYVSCGDLPTVASGRDGRPQVDAAALAAQLRTLGRPSELRAVLELAQPWPGQGVSSSFRFGVSAGVVLGVLGTLGIETEIVPARAWKTALRLGPEKSAALARARRQWPEACPQLARARDHGRAEALLIAHYTILRREVSP